MEDKLQKMPSGLPATPQQAQFRQDGNENVMVPNYGTVNITVQQMPTVLIQRFTADGSYQMPMMPGGFMYQAPYGILQHICPWYRKSFDKVYKECKGFVS
jgi:hypothetical protein